VHCFAGKSRASANTIAYLIKHMRVTLKSSLTHLKKCRPIVDPNRGFRIQLTRWEEKYLGSISMEIAPLTKLPGFKGSESK
jgi:protein-tyrosine phosphatase